MRFDDVWFGNVKRDIDAVDFTSAGARQAFADRLRRDYAYRELAMFEVYVENTGCGWEWGTSPKYDASVCRMILRGALEEARALIVQVRSNGGGAIKHPMIEMEGSGEKIPTPEMLWDLQDGLYDMTVAVLRTHAARAYERTGDYATLLQTAQETNSLVRNHLTPRNDDYVVTQEQLCEMLAAKNCPKTPKTIQRWEKWLKGDHEHGTKPPEGYTLQTRLTLEAAVAWVGAYTPKDTSKLKTKVAFVDIDYARRKRH